MNAAVEYDTELAEEQEVTLSDYLAIVKRRKRAFFLTLGSIITLAVGLAMSLPPVYRSTATVLVQQQEMTEGLIDSSLNEQVGQTVDYLIRRVMREETLWSVIEKFHLYSDFQETLPKGSLVAKMKNSINVRMVNNEVGNLKKRRGQDAQMAFDISFDYKRDPEMAQAVTKELADLFINANLEKRKKLTEETTAFLTAQAEKIQDKIKKIEDKFSEFKEKNNGLLPAQMKVLLNERERTERELLSVEQQISSIRSSTIQLRGQLAGTEAFIYEDRTLIRNDEGERVLSATGRLQTLQQRYHELVSRYSPEHPAVRKIEKEIRSLGGDVDGGANPLSSDDLELARTALAEARQKYSEDHPSVKKLEKKVARLQAQAGGGRAASNPKEFNSFKRVNPAFSALKAGVSRGQAELDSLLVRRERLMSKLDEFSSRMESSPEVEKDYERLEREHEDYVKEYRALRKKLSSAELAQALEDEQKGDRFSLQEPASLPLGPIKPNRPAIILLGTLLAIGVAFGIVMLLESLDETITSRRVLVGLTGLQPIGTIPIIMTTSETETIQRNNIIRLAALAIGFIILAGAVAWVHLNVMPLGDIWQAISRRIELMAF